MKKKTQIHCRSLKVKCVRISHLLNSYGKQITPIMLYSAYPSTTVELVSLLAPLAVQLVLLPKECWGVHTDQGN